MANLKTRAIGLLRIGFSRHPDYAHTTIIASPLLAHGGGVLQVGRKWASTLDLTKRLLSKLGNCLPAIHLLTLPKSLTNIRVHGFDANRAFKSFQSIICLGASLHNVSPQQTKQTAQSVDLNACDAYMYPISEPTHSRNTDIARTQGNATLTHKTRDIKRSR